MKFKEGKILILVVLAALLFLAGCSKTAKERPTSPSTTAPAESAPAPSQIDIIGEGVNKSSDADVNVSELDNLADNLDELNW